jgi:hypothetical protein
VVLVVLVLLLLLLLLLLRVLLLLLLLPESKQTRLLQLKSMVETAHKTTAARGRLRVTLKQHRVPPTSTRSMVERSSSSQMADGWAKHHILPLAVVDIGVESVRQSLRGAPAGAKIVHVLSVHTRLEERGRCGC